LHCWGHGFPAEDAVAVSIRVHRELVALLVHLLQVQQLPSGRAPGVGRCGDSRVGDGCRRARDQPRRTPTRRST
jgi:hypothetical protein